MWACDRIKIGLASHEFFECLIALGTTKLMYRHDATPVNCCLSIVSDRKGHNAADGSSATPPSQKCAEWDLVKIASGALIRRPP